jgi:hypothetical protein
LLEDGGVYLRHPGFPHAGDQEPERQALAYLKNLPLTRDVRAALNRSSGLEEAQRILAAMNSLRDLQETPVISQRISVVEPQAARDGPQSLRFWLVGTGVAAVLGVAMALAVLWNRDESTPPPVPQASATEVPTPPPDPGFAVCMDLQLPASLTAADAACGNGVASLAFDPSCPRGMACNRKETSGAVALGFNDRAIAYIDPSGNLAVAREDASEPVTLTNHGRAQQPAWSPDGRYLAYLMAQTVEPAPPGTEGPAPPAAPLFVTQLHVIEVDRPANDGVLFSSGAAPGLPAWLQTYASWPQWSADGGTLYFLAAPTSQPGGGQIYGVEVPRRGDGIDFSRLRSAVPPNETLVPSRLTALTLSARDFGQPQGYLGRFVVRPNGEIVTQVCEGARPSCGLGRWDGRPSRLVAAERDRVVEPPLDGPDGAFAFAADANNNASLLKIAGDGRVTAGSLKLQAPSRPLEGAWFAWRPQFALNRRGDGLIAQTGPGQLGGVNLADGAATAWREGHSPVWFRADAKVASQVPAPPATLFQTPTPEPSPTVTPSPTPRPAVRTMTLNLTARRGGSPVAGATVVALAGNDECQRGMTDSLGRVTLIFPRDGAPASCSLPNAQVRFQVNGTLVPELTQYDPQSVKVYDLTLP